MEEITIPMTKLDDLLMSIDEFCLEISCDRQYDSCADCPLFAVEKYLKAKRKGDNSHD